MNKVSLIYKQNAKHATSAWQVNDSASLRFYSFTVCVWR